MVFIKKNLLSCIIYKKTNNDSIKGFCFEAMATTIG